ncbi:hypothetical protein A5881_003595 [Enterococcus termitis]|nr:hypothetical protein A5881_003855 [Enterococcus termitis]
MIFEDEEVIEALSELKEREQIFLLEKFLLGKTDKEIGKTLGITRQGVTNLKHRTYKKIRNELRRKNSRMLPELFEGRKYANSQRVDYIGENW